MALHGLSSMARLARTSLSGAVLALVITSGCGASYQAVYAGDVRFEHCMALDAHPDVNPDIRRACWSAWVEHYTYGQTRDRVGHALMRIRQLSGIGDAEDEATAEPPLEEDPSQHGWGLDDPTAPAFGDP